MLTILEERKADYIVLYRRGKFVENNGMVCAAFLNGYFMYKTLFLVWNISWKKC